VRSASLRSGVVAGDRIAALVSNSAWTVVLFLASASMGAVFTSISPDLGSEWVAILYSLKLCTLSSGSKNELPAQRVSTISTTL